MPSPHAHSTRLTLCECPCLGRIQVDMEAFFEFSFELAEELQDLIENHRHAELRREVNRAVRR